MPFFRSFLFISIASLLVSCGLLALCYSVGGINTENGSRTGIGAYAVLEVDALADEKDIIEHLQTIGFSNPISESSQWVMLNDFASLRQIPLDEYFSRLLSFDPRNDGYAEKLKNVFVKGDKRFIYIPLKGTNIKDLHFDGILKDDYFSVKYFAAEKPLKVFFVIYALSCLAVCVVCLKKKNARKEFAAIIALLPPLFAFAFFGIGGFAAASLLLGLCVCLREPLCEMFSLCAAPQKNVKGKVLSELAAPYKIYWVFAFCFAAAIGVVTAFTELKLLFVLPATAAVFALYLFSLKVLLSGGKQRRFTPLLIIRRRMPDFSFSLYMLPFAAAALFALIITPFISASFSPAGEPYSVVTEREYFDHLAFQSSFAVKKINGEGGTYPGYKFDESGFPVTSGIPAEPLINIDDYPPFPLKHLTAFLSAVNTGGAANTLNENLRTDVFIILILLIFLLPAFLPNADIGFPPKTRFTVKTAGLKRFSLRRTGRDINRKNTLLLNRNNLLIRKDA